MFTKEQSFKSQLSSHINCFMQYFKNNKFKKLFFLSILILFIYSCVSIRFPETIKVDITVPSDFDVEKMQILIDTLRGLNKKGEKKVNGTVEFLLHKAETNKEKRGAKQKGMTAPKRN